MEQSLVASDMMATNLVTLTGSMNVYAAIDILLKKRISGAPVVNEYGIFQGVFSERSCIQFLIDASYEQVSASGLLAFVDAEPPTISSDTDVLGIAERFLNEDVRRLPVVDNGILVGQISRRDLMSAISKGMIKPPTAESRDRSLYLSALHADRTGIASRIG
jgi:CBS domain-containing protein